MAVISPVGWDSGLRTRRIQSLQPAPAIAAYADLTDAGKGHYRITSEVEQEMSHPLIGLPGQALPVNAGGELALGWSKTAEGGYAISLVLDYINHLPPLPYAFTWVAVEESAQDGGGPYCRADQLRTTVNLLWDYIAVVGGIRAFVGMGAWWDDRSAFVEVDFDTYNYGTTNPAEPEIQIAAHPPGWDFIAVNGSALGLVAPPKIATTLVIEWREILDLLIQRIDENTGHGFLPRPSDWAKSAVITTYVGMELRNFVQGPSMLGGLWLSGLRHEQVVE
jgi:hypothetical protein